MKKILAILSVCCIAFIYAEEPPVFEEVSEELSLSTYAPFAANEPVFEEADEHKTNKYKSCTECDDPEHAHHRPVQMLRPSFDEKGSLIIPYAANYGSWMRYQARFGFEKVFIRFPHQPSINHCGNLFTAYANDSSILYSLTGFFPPLNYVDPICWFDQLLYSLNQYPVTPLKHTIFQAPNGDWLMDYTAYDCVQDLIIKGRAIATPFNGYLLQCVKPNGWSDYFDYFCESWWTKCEYNMLD